VFWQLNLSQKQNWTHAFCNWISVYVLQFDIDWISIWLGSSRFFTKFFFFVFLGFVWDGLQQRKHEPCTISKDLLQLEGASSSLGIPAIWQVRVLWLINKWMWSFMYKVFLALGFRTLWHCCAVPQGIMSLQQFFHIEMHGIYMDVQIFRMLSHFSSFEEPEDDDDLQVPILCCWGVFLFE
jgi:hypothetical protein